VGLGVAVLCSLPALVALRPAPAVAVDPTRLRDLVLHSADRPYQGYVDSRGNLRLPKLPVLGDVLALAGDQTRIRAWYAGPTSWRVAVLRTTGERDIYRTPNGTYVWDFERDQIGYTPGELPVRLPWAADLTPPDLARRVLSFAGAKDRITALPARRVAGVAAAGLRLEPSDPQSTVAAVDVWADPDTGLPLRVQITGKGSADPVLVTEFLDVDQTAPQPRVLVPDVPTDAGLTVASGEEVANAVAQVDAVPLPETLLGRSRLDQPDRVQYMTVDGQKVTGYVLTGLPGIAAYGPGLSSFVVLALPGRVGFDARETARKARGTPVRIPGAEIAYQLRADVLTALIVHAHLPGNESRTYLLAGLVDPAVLVQAATELIGNPL
jgi:hypothetical protein